MTSQEALTPSTFRDVFEDSFQDSSQIIPLYISSLYKYYFSLIVSLPATHSHTFFLFVYIFANYKFKINIYIYINVKISSR